MPVPRARLSFSTGLKMPLLQTIATFVIFGGFGCAVVFHKIAERLVHSSEDAMLDSMSLKEEQKSAGSPAHLWIVRRNIATALTAIAGLGFGIALNFVS
ncbi:MAG: hypothetical protein NTV51_29010 [Verrucomicrobia bacterium]|nr:hypothetical protein [Verrucomicrobiota bacterium]